jgi:DNA-binding response OmpR family regulator
MPAKILIVDDDLQSLKLIGLMLQRRGHTISAAPGGLQALAKVESEQPDLIILDVMMDDLDGFEVCRRLRSNPKTSHIPIVMFTAKTLVSDKVTGFQAGADDYLTKPIHPNELASRIEAVLQRTQPPNKESAASETARVAGFFGVRGGVGTTTLALNVAAALASMPPPRRVTLVDLQTSAANIVMQLGLAAGSGLAALLNHPAAQIDADLVKQHLIQHASGVQLLLPGMDMRAGWPPCPPLNSRRSFTD